ncbi:MAG: VWA domain-containing protein, partial [Sphingobacteriaceae bacterium]
VLAFSAIQNNDKVGVIFFSDKIEKFIPPKKGRSHILMIIRELIDFSPENKGTNVAEALRYFTSAIKKRSTAFIISDFISSPFEDQLKIANKKHDIIALKLYDRHEEEFPNLGLIPVVDEETGELQWINTSDPEVRKAYKNAGLERNSRLKTTFSKSGVDFTSIGTHESYVKPLMTLFKKRESKR